MYVSVNGLAGRRRGLGYVNAAGVEVPGPPVNPDTPIPDQTENQIAILWDQVFGERATAGPVAPASQWVSGIPNWVTGVVGASLGLVLIKGMR